MVVLCVVGEYVPDRCGEGEVCSESYELPWPLVSDNADIMKLAMRLFFCYI